MILTLREPSSAPASAHGQNDEEAMKFLVKKGSSAFDPTAQVSVLCPNFLAQFYREWIKKITTNYRDFSP